MSNILDRVRNELQWPNVRTEKDKIEEHPATRIRVMPNDSNLPTINFLCSEDMSELWGFGFAGWHADCDIDDALNYAKQLLSQEYSIVSVLDDKGVVWGSGIYKGNEIPIDIGKQRNHTTFRREFFNKPPTEEGIDYSQYIEGKHQYFAKYYYADQVDILKKVGAL